jgi:hypothetical protein
VEEESTLSSAQWVCLTLQSEPDRGHAANPGSAKNGLTHRSNDKTAADRSSIRMSLTGSFLPFADVRYSVAIGVKRTFSRQRGEIPTAKSDTKINGRLRTFVRSSELARRNPLASSCSKYSFESSVYEIRILDPELYYTTPQK